jgi:hypothetical protein
VFHEGLQANAALTGHLADIPVEGPVEEHLVFLAKIQAVAAELKKDAIRPVSLEELRQPDRSQGILVDCSNQDEAREH